MDDTWINDYFKGLLVKRGVSAGRPSALFSVFVVVLFGTKLNLFCWTGGPEARRGIHWFGLGKGSNEACQRLPKKPDGRRETAQTLKEWRPVF
jgi:hypothetical protein